MQYQDKKRIESRAFLRSFFKLDQGLTTKELYILYIKI